MAPLPAEGRPAGYAGAVGRGLQLGAHRRAADRAPGEPVSVAFELSGEGNPALWPAPELALARCVRAYPDRDGRAARGDPGSARRQPRRFGSRGAGLVGDAPAARAPVRLLRRERRRVLRSRPPWPVPVAAATEPRRPPAACRHRCSPPRAAARAPGRSARAPRLAMGAVALLPPLAGVAATIRARRPRLVHWCGPGRSRDAEGELESLVRSLAPNADGARRRRAGGGAPRRRGRPRARSAAGRGARSAARLRYGPAAGPVPPDLAREARDARPSGSRTPRPAPRPRRDGAACCAGLERFVARRPASPEALYAEGSLHAAAERLRCAELERDPPTPRSGTISAPPTIGSAWTGALPRRGCRRAGLRRGSDGPSAALALAPPPDAALVAAGLEPAGDAGGAAAVRDARVVARVVGWGWRAATSRALVSCWCFAGMAAGAGLALRAR